MAGFSKSVGKLYDFVLYLPDHLFLAKKRRRLLEHLSGKILEVGFGTGMNFKYYNADSKITAIEPSVYMMSKAEKKIRNLPNPERFILKNIGCGDPEIEEMFQPESLDAVVCTLVLCTVPNPEQSIKNFFKWLKPGGKLVIMEHIKSHNRGVSKIQNSLNPLWLKFSGGCNLNRSTDILLKKSGFKLNREQHYWLGMPIYEAEFEKRI